LNIFLDALEGSYCTYSAYNITGDSPAIDSMYPDLLPGGYKGQLQCGEYTPTQVISASYDEAEYDLPENYVKRHCNDFMKLGLHGHTIFFQSSDFGVASFLGDDSAIGCLGPEQTIFDPDYPSGCPYLTVRPIPW
jgi:tripeptidyl-peptidase-1